MTRLNKIRYFIPHGTVAYANIRVIYNEEGYFEDPRTSAGLDVYEANTIDDVRFHGEPVYIDGEMRAYVDIPMITMADILGVPFDKIADRIQQMLDNGEVEIIKEKNNDNTGSDEKGV